MKQKIFTAASACLFLLGVWQTCMVPAAAQITIPAPRPALPPSTMSDKVSLQFPNAPLREILLMYQQLTGKRIIQDPKIEQLTLSMDSAGPMSRVAAVEFIEKSLLLAGYALVPSGKDMVKVIAFENGKSPASEGIPLFLDVEKLPETDQVVSFILPLEHLKAEEAAQVLTQTVTTHSYGTIIPVPNARALTITENSNTIRAIAALAKELDVPPTEVQSRLFPLQRADAEEVVEALSALLGIKSEGAASASGGRGAPPPGMLISSSGEPLEAPTPETPSRLPTAAGRSQGAQGSAEAAPPKLQAVARTNSILVVARPVEIAHIQTLIESLDAPSSHAGFISRTLNYLDVTDFLPLAVDALERFGNGKRDGPTERTRNSNSPQTSTFTSSATSGMGGGSSGFGGGRTGSGGSGIGTLNMEENPLPKPQSVRAGKTVLITEPSRNELFASGPPEQLRALNELLDQLDKRPQQIQLSLIIGEFTLGNDFRYGLDWINTLQNVKLGGSESLLGGVLKTTTSDGSSLRDISDLAGAADFIPALQGLTIYGQIGDHANLFLTALDQSNRFKVLQRPAVVTLNHKPAMISTGLDLAIPGQTLTSASQVNADSQVITSTTDYVPVRLSLGVIPHIFNGSEVKLELQQINSDVSSYSNIGGNQVPNISTQELKNTIIVPDGATVLLGGLITERDRNAKSGLPVLSRIPVIKHLFGSTSKTKERRELLILVQPHILPSGQEQVEAQADITSGTMSYPAVRQFGEPQAESTLFPPQAAGTSASTEREGLPKLHLRSKK